MIMRRNPVQVQEDEKKEDEEKDENEAYLQLQYAPD